MKKSASLLKVYFERKRKSKTGFSVRSFARAEDLSPSFISALLTGKKLIPLARIDQLCRALELDSAACEQIKRKATADHLKASGFAPEKMRDKKRAAIENFAPMPKSQFSILSPWYNVAILDLSTCDHFQKEPLWIAAQLGLSRYQVTVAIRQLLEQGLLVETESGYEKVEKKIRLALSSSHIEIRKFHYQMIEKAQEELTQKTSQEDFERREISGVTIAANPAHIAKARQVILDAIHEAAELLSQGECTELYQINTQLFSLLKKTPSKIA